MQALVDHSLSPDLLELLQIHRRQVARQADRAYLFRTLLYAVSVMLLFYVAATVLRLRATARALSENNRAMAREMAERRAAEARDRAHLEQLANIGRLSVVGEMTTQLAHELNQPLCAISTYCQGALRMLQTGDVQPGQLARTLEQARDQAGRASEIIRRVRELVRREPSRRFRSDINAVVRAAVSLVGQDLQARGVSVVLRLEPQLPAVTVDAIQIEQVVLNLLRNAIDALQVTERDGGDVIEVESGMSENGEIRVCVRDHGEGLSGEDLERVFEPFETSKPDGLGLGLSISRTIIEHHGGRIWAESPAGGGTRFCFTLPLQQEGSGDA
jgi:two-component system sensor histidine kinase TtrS